MILGRKVKGACFLSNPAELTEYVNVSACEPNIKLEVAGPKEVSSKHHRPKNPALLQRIPPPLLLPLTPAPIESIVLASGLLREQEEPTTYWDMN